MSFNQLISLRISKLKEEASWLSHSTAKQDSSHFKIVKFDDFSITATGHGIKTKKTILNLSERVRAKIRHETDL